MHRSGTSAMAGALGSAGLELPSRLVGSHDSNRKGHFEPADIVPLNDAFFEAQGLSWYNCAVPDQSDPDRVAAAADEIVSALNANFAFERPCVVKDPRIARLDRVWTRVAESGGFDFTYVLMYRDPGAVAESLHRRNGWPSERGLWLWLAHVAGAARLAETAGSVWMNSDRFVADPVAALESVRRAAGPSWQIPGDRIDAVRDFVEKSMLGTARIDCPVWRDEIESALDAVRRLDSDASDAAALAVLDCLADFVADRGASAEETCRVAERYWAGHETVRATLEEERARALALTGDIDGLQAQLRSASDRVDELASGMETALGHLEAERDRAALLEEKVAEAVHERREVSAKLNRVLGELEEQSLQTSFYANRFGNLLTTAQWLAEKAAKAERKLPATIVRRLAYGIAKSLARRSFLKGTRLAASCERVLVKHGPKRFYRALDEVLAKHDNTPSHFATVPRPVRALAAPDGDGCLQVALTTSAPPLVRQARVIAFYLPQYHPIPENDLWWGKGFTEWHNASRARPQFEGHYQPHLPGELGFYDLRVPEVQRRQAELARLYGIDGFCYYFYWFGGKTLLETPLRQMLRDPEVDIPFCLCWANENWTRRWDGLEQNVLIAQEHSPEDDLAFIAHIAPYLNDPRYIRVDGKPLLVVYRPNLLPDMAATAQRWRDWCRQNGIGEIHLCMTESFERVDPSIYGLDASIEFPPNNTDPPDITSDFQFHDPEFHGKVYDWRVFPERAGAYAAPAHNVYRGVCTSWDNTARRGAGGTYFDGATPEGFRKWLGRAMEETARRKPVASDRLVFVNAWNEWAEGAHLEPDTRYGYAWLEAVRQAHLDANRRGRGSPLAAPIAVVAHDAHRHGAQLLALNLCRIYADDLGADVHAILLDDGPLLPEFEKVAKVHRLCGQSPAGSEGMSLVARLRAAGVTHAIVNSLASGAMAKPLASAGIGVTTLVHELPGLIREHGLEDAAEIVAQHARTIVFPAEIVAREFARIAPCPPEKSRVQPQGLYFRRFPQDASLRLSRRGLGRQRWGAGESSLVVLGAGFGDHRKGIDLFVDLAIDLCGRSKDFVFVWIGLVHGKLEPDLRDRIAAAGLVDRVLLPGFIDDVTEAFLSADMFLLSSREDPFPSVVLEAMEAGLPVVAIAGTGGCADLVAEGFGRLAASATVADLRDAVLGLRDPDARAELGAAGRAMAAERFSFRTYALDVASDWGARAPRVSVVLPNYNYLRYLPDRVRSIIDQTWPVYELIVLDDASTDGSREWLEKSLFDLCPDARLIQNAENSGSVFHQWSKGIRAARGDLVWIAEADDDCDRTMLERLVGCFADPDVCLAYAQSRAIDTTGSNLPLDYRDYTADISRDKWNADFVETATEALSSSFAVKNVIPNVSGALFRRDRLVQSLTALEAELQDWKVAGDWRIYVECLSMGGKIAFVADHLNIHRRHASSVTHALKAERHVEEIAQLQRLVADRSGSPDATRAVARNYLETIRKQLLGDPGARGGRPSPAPAEWTDTAADEGR